jgi:peptidoglycan/xylan/chitin deacetylase (PgdA/CDA1 family)
MGQRATACFTFDNMGEAAEIGEGTLAGVVDGGHPSLTIGYPRLFSLLEGHGVRSTFFLEGWNGDHHREAVREVVERGHELGMHGWLHEEWGALDVVTERELAVRSTDALTQAAGQAPVGFRAPGGTLTAATESILADLDAVIDAASRDERVDIAPVGEVAASLP